MNKLIKELAAQANISYWPDPEFGSLTNSMVVRHELEKFADLIVAECINVVIGCDESPKMVLHEPYRTITNRLAEHFEVLGMYDEQ